jgi:hypothetical protein
MKLLLKHVCAYILLLGLLLPVAQASSSKTQQKVEDNEQAEQLSDKQIVRKVKRNQQWQAQQNQCPAELAPAKRVKFSRKESRIDSDAATNLNMHYQACVNDDKGYACYNLAMGLQTLKYDDEAEVVFQQACRLGVAFGCTNRAAGMLSARPQNKRVMRCATKSFAKACDWKDPWGCTMYAGQLVAGDGVKKDSQKALSVLKNSCLSGKDDPACQAAQRIKQYIKAEQQSEKQR